MTMREFYGVSIGCVQGDIAEQPVVEAIVNAANAELRTGGGVAGAIHRAAGPELEAECRPLAPIEPGEAVITAAYNLPNRYVIHCLGPVYGVDNPSERLLAACYRNALQLAENYGISSIAFPAISTGAFGYPLESATRIALNTTVDMLAGLSAVNRIDFVLFSSTDQQLYEQILTALTET